jgi:hypothetical protein
MFLRLIDRFGPADTWKIGDKSLRAQIGPEMLRSSWGGVKLPLPWDVGGLCFLRIQVCKPSRPHRFSLDDLGPRRVLDVLSTRSIFLNAEVRPLGAWPSVDREPSCPGRDFVNSSQRGSWSESFLDGSFAPAKKGATESEKTSGARGRSGWWWSTARVFLWETTFTLPPRRKSGSRRRRSDGAESFLA